MSSLLLGMLFNRLFVDPFSYFSTDNSDLYFPSLVMLSRALHQGYWPFLNPYWFAGALPFASLESGAMYPATLLAAAVIHPSWSLNSIYFVFLGLSFLHYVLGACSMYVLLRRYFGLCLVAASLGALCYAFGGSFLGRFSHQPVLYALAWLPLAVGGAMRFAKTDALSSAGLTIVVVWLIGVSSHPQVFLYAFVVVAAAVVWFSLTADWPARAAKLGRGLAVLVLALGLLAPRILPLYEFSRVTMRLAALTTITALFDSLSPLYYLTLLVPGLFGRHGIGYWGTDHPLGNWDSLLYLGVLPVLCACFAFFHERWRDWGFALAGAAVASFLMLGKHWALSAWVNQHLPLSQVLTGLSKLTIVLHFFLALLAAFGAEALLARGRRVPIVVVAVAMASTVIGLLAWLSPEVVAGLAPAGRRPPSEEAVRFAVQSVRQTKMVALVSLATVLAAIVVRRTAKVFFVPVLVADLVLSLGHFNPIEAGKGEPAIYYGGDAATRFMQGDRDLFRVANVMPANGGMVFGLESAWGYHTVVTTAYIKVHPFLSLYDRSVRGIYNLANIKYQRRDGDLSSDNFAQVAPGLWLNREVLPRVFFVGRCHGFPNTNAMASFARSPSFDPSRELMLFESDCPGRPEAKGSCTLQSAGSRERYVADCTVEDGGGWAFFSVVQYPGWTSIVNGRAATLVPAAIAFYAVPLAAGRQRVELVHHSRGLLYGLWIAAGTGILALGLGGWSARRNRASTVPAPAGVNPSVANRGGNQAAVGAFR